MRKEGLFDFYSMQSWLSPPREIGIFIFTIWNISDVSECFRGGSSDWSLEQKRKYFCIFV